MKRELVVFTAIVVLSVFVTMPVATASPDVIYVPDNYPTIQQAIDNANPSDTIIVRDGTYNENVNVYKSLTIRSENGSASTIVQAATIFDHVFEVTADYVNISGFTAKGATGDGKVGVYLNRVDHCNISNDNALNNYEGIHLDSSSNNTITNNNASNNNRGILLRCSNNNTITKNSASNNDDGIRLSSSSNNNLLNNTANVNSNRGIYLSYSSNNRLTNNTMSGNKYNFHIYGDAYLSHYIQNIDTSNLVDGKPIYYWINQQNQQVPTDAGFVGLVNSTNITVKDLTLTKNGCGLQFIQTNDSKIENVSVSNTYYGIYLFYCNNNTIINNNVSNGHYGIYLTDSPYNNISHNVVEACAESGIILDYSPTPGPYLPPVGYNDPDDKWTDAPLAYDGDVDTYAKGYVGNTASSWLELIAPSGKTSQGIRFWVNRGDLRIEIYYDESWHCLKDWNWPYAQAPTNQWVELDYSEETVEKARIRFNRGMMGGYSSHLHEFQFKTTPSDYSVSDANGDGIGDTPYSIDSDNDNYPLMEPWENYFAPPENKPPTCAIELQKNGIPIDSINVGEFFDIYVGGSTDDQGIKEVRFSSDESQDGIPTGEWTEWYGWDISSGDWDAANKIKAWSFATGGKKEVWAEVKDDGGNVARCHANIFAHPVAVISVTSSGSFLPIYEIELWPVPPDQIVTAKIADSASLPIEVEVYREGLPTAGARVYIQEESFPLGMTDENGIAKAIYPITHPPKAEDFKVHIGVEVDSSIYSSELMTLYSSRLLGAMSVEVTGDEAKWYPSYLMLHYLLQPGIPAPEWLLGIKMIDLLTKVAADLKDYDPEVGDILHLEAFEYTAPGIETAYAVHLTIERGGIEIYERTQWTDKYELVEPITLFKLARGARTASLASPANFWVTDPSGRQAGIDPQTGELVFEFPMAITPPEEEHQLIVIPEPLDGGYKFCVIGTQEGSYNFICSHIDETGHVSNTFTSTDIPTADGAIHKYTMDWDALSQGEEGVTVQVDSDGDGEFEQTFTADDELTQEEYLSATNLPPIADANGPYTGIVGGPITFNGTGSYDPDGTIVSYEWDIDDDGEFDDAIGPAPSKTWDIPYSGTIGLKVTDDDGGVGTDTVIITVLAAYDIKEDAITDLKAINTTDEHAQKDIDEAIKHINKSLEDSLWVDASHLDPKHGHKVFDEEKKAVEDIMHDLIKCPECCDVGTNVIDKLVTADKILAETALNDAISTNVTDPKNQDKVDKEIAKAEEELAKAYQELSKGKPDKAIDHYKKAWEHAQQAIKHAQKLPKK